MGWSSDVDLLPHLPDLWRLRSHLGPQRPCHPSLSALRWDRIGAQPVSGEMAPPPSVTALLLTGESLWVPADTDGSAGMNGWYHYIKTSHKGLFFHAHREAKDGRDGYRVWVDDQDPGYRRRIGRIAEVVER